MTLWWKRNFYNQHNHLKIGKAYPEAFKTDGTSPIALGNWTKKNFDTQSSAKSGCLCFIYKKSFSIVLLALCGASYQFTVVDIGDTGRQIDDGLFTKSNLGRSIVNDYFNLPEPKQLYSESEFLFAYAFVGGDAFPMRHNLLKPYSLSNVERVLLIFNKRLSRSRRTIENTILGILAARFKIFGRPILLPGSG